MLLTKREEQLMKAFLQVGKLSLKEMADILQVSSGLCIEQFRN